MRTTAEARVLVLHGTRLRGFGEVADIAAVVGLDEDTVSAELARLAADGLVTRRDGAVSGWSPTAEGRAEQERLLATELAAAGCREQVEQARVLFGPVNRELLEACTDWQLRDGRTNDHTDPTHDRAAIERLVQVHEQVEPVLELLEGCLDRFLRYRPRLQAAIDHVLAGDTDWFAKPGIDSYHTVWFQLHEDLLNTLGLDRAAEADGDKE